MEPNTKKGVSMAQCPFCKRHDIFGEQISYLNIVSDHFYFDCPRCGAFRMTSRTRGLVMEIHTTAAEELVEWILGHNSSNVVPQVSEHFVARVCSNSREKVLQ
ncbi:MAG: hypothetical protein ACYC6O_05660 [Thermoleophilia bacterium]